MIVSVHALFSSSSKIGAKIIACGTKPLAKHVCKTSHTALLVNERWVHESTGQNGVTVSSYPAWQKIHTEVDRVQLPDIEYQDLADKFRTIKGKKYDYLGVFYIAYRVLLWLLFGAAIPKHNKWESRSRYFCCEVLGQLTGQYYGMMAPNQILASLKSNYR